MENDKEIFEKAFGLDADEMTMEQKDTLREVVNPTKTNWLSTVGIAIFIVAIISLLQLDFVWFLIFALIGIALYFAPYFITRNKAFKKYENMVSPIEYAEFIEQNKIFYPMYFIQKYGNSIISICALIGLIYCFFNWRVGVTIFLFSWNILIPIKYTLTTKMKMKWSWIAFFGVAMGIVWMV